MTVVVGVGVVVVFALVATLGAALLPQPAARTATTKLMNTDRLIRPRLCRSTPLTRL